MSLPKNSDLDNMVPTPSRITVSGEEIEICNLKVKQLSAVLKAIRPFIGAFTSTGSQIDVPTLIMDHTENVIDLICILTGKDSEWVGELDLEEMITVFSKIVEVNLSFFTLKVFPSLSLAMGQLSGAVQGAKKVESQTGLSPSKPS